MLTNYPGRNDVLTVLDGAVLLSYIAAATAAMTLAVGLPLAAAVRLSGRWSWQRFHHLAHGLIPLAAIGVILGLSAMTVTQLRADGFALGWMQTARFWALAVASIASVWLLARIPGRYASGVRLVAATAVGSVAMLAPLVAWWLLFWHW